MALSIQSEMQENTCLPLVMRELPEEFVKKAEVELGETPEKREKCITELRKLILGEKDLTCRTDDEFLILLLRARKFDYYRAFATLKKLCKIKMELYFFRRLENINSFYDILETGMLTFLHYRDPEGRAILIFRLRNWNPDEKTLDDLLACGVGLIYIALDFPMSQVNGGVVIIDLKGFNLSYLKHIGIRYVRILLQVVQDSCPFRLKAVHLVNESIFFKTLWKIFKPFLKKKLRKRIFVHGENMKSLHQLIPPSILPPEYGGNLDRPDICEQSRETRFGENFFLDLKKTGYKKDEQKLKNKLKK